MGVSAPVRTSCQVVDAFTQKDPAPSSAPRDEVRTQGRTAHSIYGDVPPLFIFHFNNLPSSALLRYPAKRSFFDARRVPPRSIRGGDYPIAPNVDGLFASTGGAGRGGPGPRWQRITLRSSRTPTASREGKRGADTAELARRRPSSRLRASLRPRLRPFARRRSRSGIEFPFPSQWTPRRGQCLAVAARGARAGIAQLDVSYRSRCQTREAAVFFFFF